MYWLPLKLDNWLSVGDHVWMLIGGDPSFECVITHLKWSTEGGVLDEPILGARVSYINAGRRVKMWCSADRLYKFPEGA